WVQRSIREQIGDAVPLGPQPLDALIEPRAVVPHRSLAASPHLAHRVRVQTQDLNRRLMPGEQIHEQPFESGLADADGSAPIAPVVSVPLAATARAPGTRERLVARAAANESAK